MASALADWSKGLHKSRGTGSGARINLDFEKLVEYGWTVSSRQVGTKKLFTFTDPEGRKHKSAKEVERALQSEGMLDRFIKAEALVEHVEDERTEEIVAAETVSETFDDPDYEQMISKLSE